MQAEKLLLIEQLLQIQDGKVIAQVRKLLEKSYNPIVGYEANGKPVTQRDFVKSIEQAEAEHRSGNFQSIDEVEKESESW